MHNPVGCHKCLVHTVTQWVVPVPNPLGHAAFSRDCDMMHTFSHYTIPNQPDVTIRLPSLAITDCLVIKNQQNASPLVPAPGLVGVCIFCLHGEGGHNQGFGGLHVHVNRATGEKGLNKLVQ